MNEKNVVPLQPKSENVFTKEEQMKAFNSISRKVVARQKCRANTSRGGGHNHLFAKSLFAGGLRA